MVTANALTIKIPDKTGYVGKTITILVNIEGATDVGSVELTIVYNSSLLDVKKVEKGSLLKGLITYNASEKGVIAINLIDSNGINGDGEIAKITFDILSTTAVNTTLLLQNVKAYDVNTYTVLPVDTINGILNISTGGGSSSQTPGFELVTFLSVFVLLTIPIMLRRK